MLKQFRYLLLYFSLLYIPVVGQESGSSNLIVTAGVHHGFVVAHRPMIVPLQKDHVTAMEAGIAFIPDGKKDWHKIYGLPKVGLSLGLWNLGNPEQLGTSVSLIPYLDLPLIKGKRSALDLKCGWGLGYIEKPFDADDNHKNIAIGSHLNCALLLQPRFKTHITDQLIFDCGISLTHFSNGSTVTPNLGLNLVCLSGGLSYRLGKNPDPVIKERPSFSRSSRVAFYTAAAFKQVYPADGKNYFACSISGEKMWQLSLKSGFGFGADVFYDASISQKLEERNMNLNNSLESLRLGIHGGYEMAITDLSFIFNFGGYLYTKLTNDGNLYQRVGMRYRFNERLFALIQLKAHWGKADFVEWGLGFRIDKKKRI